MAASLVASGPSNTEFEVSLEIRLEFGFRGMLEDGEARRVVNRFVHPGSSSIRAIVGRKECCGLIRSEPVPVSLFFAAIIPATRPGRLFASRVPIFLNFREFNTTTGRVIYR